MLGVETCGSSPFLIFDCRFLCLICFFGNALLMLLRFVGGGLMRRRPSLWGISRFCGLALILSFSIGLSAWVGVAAATGSERLSDTQRRIVLSVVGFPRAVLNAFSELFSRGDGVSVRLLIPVSGVVQAPDASVLDFDDSGYLLFSGVDFNSNSTLVRLIRLSDGHVMAEWRPNWDLVLRGSSRRVSEDGVRSNGLLAVNPALLADGSIVFNTWYSLVKLGACESIPAWVVGGDFSHSVEVDEELGSIWTVAVGGGGYADNRWLASRVIDDAIGEFDLQGRLVALTSVAGLLRRNGLDWLLFGFQGSVFSSDPLHLNQISVARYSTDFWRRGDLLLSLRNISTIIIYRPSEDRVVWIKSGPWANQHSALFFGDTAISVLSNNSNVAVPKPYGSLPPAGLSKVFVYDFSEDALVQPFSDLLRDATFSTLTQGRAQLLRDGGLFVEETDRSRLMRFSKDRLVWSWSNGFGPRHFGALAWSRYLYADEVEPVLESVRRKGCSL